MYKDVDKYVYEGPVMRFERCVDPHWKATTTAISEKKAMNNLAYRYKRDHNLEAAARIALPGKITKVM